jgi:MoxR-like ATPase
MNTAAPNSTFESVSQATDWLQTKIIGQEHLIQRLMMTLLCGGHLLVEGAPGLAKTRAIKELARVIEGEFHRIQFTPDLLPSDVTGTEIYRPEDGSFVFQEGPIFHNLILADEINRAPAKVQSALLEAMAEHQVSVGRETFPLADLFLVMATQNPIEQEGTYPLPEAQLDRFLVQIDVAYPDRDTERDILLATTGETETQATPVFTADELLAAQRLLRRMPVGESVVEMILDLVRAFRPEEEGASARVRESVAWGPGPRAAQSLMLAVRARALLQGRLAPSAEDVIDMARPVLSHRMALNFAARARGDSLQGLIEQTAASLSGIKAAA